MSDEQICAICGESLVDAAGRTTEHVTVTVRQGQTAWFHSRCNPADPRKEPESA